MGVWDKCSEVVYLAGSQSKQDDTCRPGDWGDINKRTLYKNVSRGLLRNRVHQGQQHWRACTAWGLKRQEEEWLPELRDRWVQRTPYWIGPVALLEGHRQLQPLTMEGAGGKNTLTPCSSHPLLHHCCQSLTETNQKAESSSCHQPPWKRVAWKDSHNITSTGDF